MRKEEKAVLDRFRHRTGFQTVDKLLRWLRFLLLQCILIRVRLLTLDDLWEIVAVADVVDVVDIVDAVDVDSDEVARC